MVSFPAHAQADYCMPSLKNDKHDGSSECPVGACTGPPICCMFRHLFIEKVIRTYVLIHACMHLHFACCIKGYACAHVVWCAWALQLLVLTISS